MNRNQEQAVVTVLRNQVARAMESAPSSSARAGWAFLAGIAGALSNSCPAVTAEIDRMSRIALEYENLRERRG